MKRSLSSALAACLLAALVAGCSKKEEPAPPTPPPKKPSEPAKPSQPPAAAAVQKPVSSATRQANPFDFSKKTDPFKPYAPPAAQPPAAAQNQAQPNAAPAVPPADQLPIQSFEVSKFKVVGIIAGLRENRALLVDPNGKAYVVQQGMQIGNSNGRITKITAYGVEVVERVKEGTGRYRQRKIVLTLAKKR
ncbi:MAG TPA: pilus assembly protein PilP [Geomonas sp.]|nr:pilus assembly protein PilP [Geomonas sp.]